MTTVTKICLAMLLAAISATALFFLLHVIGYSEVTVLALILGLVVAVAALYSCLNIATVGDKKIKILLILFFISAFILSVGFSGLEKSNTNWHTRYIDHQ